MTRDDDKKPAMDRDNYQGGFSPEVIEWMRHRTREIQRATQRKGMPDTYGAGKKRLEIPPMPKGP